MDACTCEVVLCVSGIPKMNNVPPDAARIFCLPAIQPHMLHYYRYSSSHEKRQAVKPASFKENH